MIDRRELLRGFGASAALSAIASGGCGPRLAPRPRRPDERESLRAALRAAVERLSQRLAEPSGFLLERTRIAVFIDGRDVDVFEQRSEVVVLSGTAPRGRLERCRQGEVDPRWIGVATDELLADADGPSRPARSLPAAREDVAAMERESRFGTSWIERARELAGRAQRVASSRLIYRAAYLTAESDRACSISERGDLEQRQTRTRAGVTFVAWHGAHPMTGEAELATMLAPHAALLDGSAVLDDAILDDAAIERAAADALALFTPTAPARGIRPVVLDPRVVAAVLDRTWPRLLRGGEPPPAPLLTLRDDPTISGYGGYRHDDAGAPGAAVVLLANGRVHRALGVGHERRCPPSWRLEVSPSNLIVEPGTTPAEELHREVDDGMVVTHPRGVFVAPTGQLFVHARAREVLRGRLTGRAWHDVELQSDVAALFAEVRGISAEAATIGVADDRPARTISAPWLATRAMVDAGGRSER